LQRYGSFEAGRQRLGSKHHLGRLGRLQEIAEAALSRQRCGDLLVDGGYTAL
jgi:hypothetical protein